MVNPQVPHVAHAPRQTPRLALLLALSMTAACSDGDEAFSPGAMPGVASGSHAGASPASAVPGAGGAPQSTGAAGDALPSAGGSQTPLDAAPAASPFPPVTDFASRGPFDTATEAAPFGVACTIVRPATLGEGGLLHPVILWGNGTAGNPGAYGPALDHWASHGFIVAAADTSMAGTGQEMLRCLDWVTEQHATAGTPYSGAVDTSHVGASGHSQGGGGTIMAGLDARVTVTAPLEPYTEQGFGGFDQSAIADQHGPMFLMSGDADIIAPAQPNQQRVYEAVNTPVFWGTLAGADHVTSALGDITGFRGPSTAWFRLHLMGDESARGVFYGASCELCVSADWDVRRKGIE